MMKCSWCRDKAIYHRKYEGTYLCKKHFLESVESKVKKTIRKDRMIEHDDTIAFALSGGKDSTTVMYMIKKLFGKRRDLKFFAISIDEGISGYRDESLRIAKKLCKKLGIPHYIFSFKEFFGSTLDEKIKIIRKREKNIWEGRSCTYCGVARRWLLNKKARELGATKICFGMNLDDEIQGILMDYIRGDLVRLSRMGGGETLVKNKLFVPRIKPFREIPEKEIGLYALLSGLEIQENECPYIEGPRFMVRDFLNSLEAESPGIKFSVLKTFEHLLPHVKEIVRKKEFEILKCEICGEPSSQRICKTCELWRS